jgi:energy-coupling factor transporter transmembrane protein EcfT
MDKVLNISILLIEIILPILIIYLVYKILKKKYRIILPTITIVILVTLLVVFYMPSSTAISRDKATSISFITDNQHLQITDQEQQSSVLTFINEQKFIRSTKKTIFDIPSSPSNQYLELRISGIDEPFNVLISVRLDNYKESYMQKDGQFFTIRNANSFGNQLNEIYSKLK